MIRIRQIKINIDENSREHLLHKVANKLRINQDKIQKLKINKVSLDARKEIEYVYEVDVEVPNENKYLTDKDIIKTPDETYHFPAKGKEKLNHRPIIIGSGPAGLFAAYILAENGYKPLIIERGEKVEDRIKTVEKFWKEGKLNPNSNVQFGEGGAGTFSDGKLNTQNKDKLFRNKRVLEIFAQNGAPQSILYLKNPHIGTDLLTKVIKNIREKIIKMGGEFRYNTLFTNFDTKDGQLTSIELNYKEKIPCDVLVLATGHSSRDTFKMLYENKITMTPKPFAVGLRLQHPQTLINLNQYKTLRPDLPPASYKLTYQTKSKRGVYSFCMCPGGYVVNSSSEEGYLAINGMSNHKRDTTNANSAIIVTVTENDFGHHPMDGIEFQKKLEKLAFQKGKGNIPIQLYKDYKENKISKSFGNIQPVFKGNYTFTNINEILPDYINESLKEAIENFDTKIKGFAGDDTILAGVETRTSSPIRILRDEDLVSNIKGIYPCGEGAGYSGGIMTSAIDGIKVAEAIGKKYQTN